MSHLAARGYRILFVNSIGLGFPSLRIPKVGTRILLKLKSLTRWIRRADSGVWVHTPVVIPLWSIPFLEKLNVALLAAQTRFLLWILGIRKPLFWAGLPTAALLLDHIPHRRSVYYMADNYLAYYDRLTFTRIREHHDRMKRPRASLCGVGLISQAPVTLQGSNFIRLETVWPLDSIVSALHSRSGSYVQI